MITVKIWGGLCNQMFQYAYGYAMGRTYNEDVHFDTDFYKNQPKYVDSRTLDICSFFTLPYFDVDDRPKQVKLFQNRILSNIVRRMDFFHCQLSGNIFYVREREHTYSDHVPYCKGKNNFYDGYWQSEKYFADYAEDIRRIFEPSAECKEKIQNWMKPYIGKNTVAVHIRRGDMEGRNEGYSEKAIMDYYHRAMKTMREKVSDCVFVVFSDAIPWCKEHISHEYGEVVFQDQNLGGLFDLMGIAACKHGVMSQSTFSWWGNWLGDKDQSARIVIAPKGEYLNNEFIPARWIKV